MNSKPETRNSKLRVAIFGGSGYGGSELLRILLFHPNAEIVFVTANEQAGKAVSEVHKNLHGLTDLKFRLAPEDPTELADLDCVFLALPHGQAMDVVPRLPENVKAIDLSGDFRLRDQQVFEQHYGRAHTAMQSQGEFVYGLTGNKSRGHQAGTVDCQSRLLRHRHVTGAGAAGSERTC